MPLLHFVQSRVGFVDGEGIELIAKLLTLETAEVSAVASFYNLEVCKKWSGNLKNAIIIEIEAVLNLTNFEIDYELGFREVDNKQMKPAEYYKILFNTTKDMCSKNNLNFYRIDFIQGDEEKQKINNLVKVTEPNWGNIFVLSEDELTKDDINLSFVVFLIQYIGLIVLISTILDKNESPLSSRFE
jgi:hypothetical protein